MIGAYVSVVAFSSRPARAARNTVWTKNFLFAWDVHRRPSSCAGQDDSVMPVATACSPASFPAA